MRTINPTRLPLALLLFTTLAEMPASAFYNSNTGRWLNRDPIEEGGGLGLYVFVKNESLTHVDPRGLVPVLKSTPHRLRPGICGGFSWGMTWSLGPAPEAADATVGGIIVQLVTASFNITDCRGGPLGRPVALPPPVDPDWWPLYEAWSVNPGRARTTGFTDEGRPVDDNWDMPSFDESNVGVPTRGTITLTGAADFYDGQVLPSDFIATGQPPTGTLPTSKFFMPVFPGSGSVTRSLVATWDCCCVDPKDKVTKITTSISP